MKTRIMVVLLSLAGFVHADIVPPVRWDVETGRMEPRPYTLAIRRGENVKIEPRFLTYNVPMSLTNAAVEMRYSAAYNSATFYSVFGTLQAETGRVQIAWSDALNPTNSSMVYEIRATVGTNVLARAFGSLYLLGGMVGLSTGLTARTSINWSTVAQSGGVAVLTNQMGSGAVWNGTQWTFGAGSVDLSFTNLYYRASNPSNYCTLAAAAGLTNGLQAAGVYLVPADTNRFVDASITNGLGGGSYTETDPVWAAASGSVVYANFQSLQSGNAGGPVGWNSIGVGQNVSADNLAAVFGQSSYAGLVGFAAGQEAIGGPGSFVYSTFLQDEPFNRTAHTNEFAVRAAGGAYFEVPTLQVSGTVSAVSFSGSGAALTGVLKPADTNGYVKAGITNGVWAKGDSVTNADLTTSTGLLPDGSLGTNSTRTVSNLTVKAGATVGTLNGLTPSTILTNIPAVITPVTLTLDAGNTATVQNVFYNDLGVLETNVTIVIGPTMTNTAQARSFWLDWSNTTYSITFPVGSFSNITANTATTNKAWSSYWHAGKGQTIFTGGWR